MQRQLAVAGLILAAVVAAGVWYARPSQSSSKDPVQLRDEIGQSDAVVVSFHPSNTGKTANPEEGDSTLTLIRGDGWTWQRTAVTDGLGAAMVVSSSTQTFTAVAPDCYLAIPEAIAPQPPEVPGVNLVVSLASAPGLKHSGDVYSYRVSSDDRSVLVVTEDLDGIAQNHRYTARVMASGASPNSPDLSGRFTVRQATAAERTAAERLIETAQPSATTPVRMQLRVAHIAVGEPNTEVQQSDLVSPEACPRILSPDFASLHATVPLPLTSLGEGKPGQFAGVPMDVGRDAVTVSDVVPIAEFNAPMDVLADAFISPVLTQVTIAPGATFGVTIPSAMGDNEMVMHVVSCTPAAWFPCGG